MRDQSDIYAQCAEAVRERVERAACQVKPAAVIRAQQEAHGRRVEERQRVNGQ